MVAGYSMGVKQTFARMFMHFPGINLMVKADPLSPEQYHNYASSVFCLVAAGWGWSASMKIAVTRGCIPLIVQARVTAVQRMLLCD